MIPDISRAFHDPAVTFKKQIPKHQTYEGTINHYAQNGYDCLILWDDELSNRSEVIQRIEEFVND